MGRASSVTALAAAALFACGGSQLPSYGAPQGEVMADAELQGADLIPYRALTRADFLGSAPTGAAASHIDRVGAQTHVVIKHEPGVAFAGKETRSSGGKRLIAGKINNLRFRAWMDRSRSWWNPKPGQAPEGYVLQHEQIHFALAELESRAMNLEAEGLMQRTFEGDDPKEIQADLDAAIDDIMKEGMARLLDRQLEFDEDTSARYDSAKQNQWYARVERELAAKH